LEFSETISQERTARVLEKLVSEKNLEKQDADQIKIVAEYHNIVSALESEKIALKLERKALSNNINDLTFKLGKSKEEFVEETKRHEIECINLNEKIGEHIKLLESLKSELNDLHISKQAVDSKLVISNKKNTDLLHERAKDKAVLKELKAGFCFLKSIQDSLVIDITEFSAFTETILTKLDEQDISFKERERNHELLNLSLLNEKNENMRCKIDLEKSQKRS
jgi:hypothetical protein